MWQTKTTVNYFTGVPSSTYALSSIDKKGRVFIPIRLRAKLRFLEDISVRLAIKDGKLLVEKEVTE